MLGAIGVLFLLAGAVHWLILLGVWEEKTTPLVDLYFNSLAVLSPLAALGLRRLKNWGRILAVAICLTQFPAHFAALALQYQTTEGVEYWRIADLLFCLGILLVLTARRYRNLFQ